MDYFIKDSGVVLQAQFPPTIINDAEVINRDELLTFIKNFVEFNKIVVGELILVLSDALFFMKDFPALPLNQQKIEIEKYIDIVPFENIGYKMIPMEKGFRLIATNKDLYELIVSAFEHTGFTISYIFPAHITGVPFTTLGINEGNYILGRIDILKQYNLMDEKLPVKTQFINETEKEHVPKSNNKLVIGGGITFIILVGVLIFMLLGQKP